MRTRWCNVARRLQVQQKFEKIKTNRRKHENKLCEMRKINIENG